jgi:dTDP-glucose 4,6-dehydratase
MPTLFITGGAGFIGSNFIRYWLDKYPADSIITYDLLTYAATWKT